MPLISVVIPVHGVADYLDRCLDSVLGQDGASIEVIAVDDASPDSSGQLLAARRDPRLKVIRNDSPAGPGHARELGAKEAAGDYVWFVDGDDELAGGALAAVAAELDRAHPDVLIVDYENLYQDGSASPSGARLRAADATTLEQRPALIHLTMTVWSKVFRREFLASLGVPFGPGIHEDVPVSAAALLAAGRIAVLDRVCYRYRRSRRGSFMAATTDRHFDIFTSYNQIFNERAVVPPVRAALFERAIWHYTTVFPLVPQRRRREFFGRMTADFRRWCPGEFVFPPGPRGAKLRLVGRGAYQTYRVLEPLNRLRIFLTRRVARR
jgi:CDP-glycerol glycerophosphotransferase